jgi:hypothetical protein
MKELHTSVGRKCSGMIAAEGAKSDDFCFVSKIWWMRRIKTKWYKRNHVHKQGDPTIVLLL